MITETSYESPFADTMEFEEPIFDLYNDAGSDAHLDFEYFSVPAVEGEISRATYKRKLIEGINKLDPASGGGITFGAPTNTMKFYSADWKRQRDTDFGRRFNPPRSYRMLVLRSGKSPSKALRRIVDNPGRWSFDCAYFVQVAHLYATSQVDPDAFDRKFRDKPFLLRYHNSSGVAHNFFFDRNRKSHNWRAWFRLKRRAKRTLNPINNTRWNDATIKAAMPIGSRLMWRNNLIRVSDKSDFRNENAVKVGPDEYRAFGLGIRRRITEKELREALANIGMNGFPSRHDPALSVVDYARQHIFLSEAARFYTP